VLFNLGYSENEMGGNVVAMWNRWKWDGGKCWSHV